MQLRHPVSDPYICGEVRYHSVILHRYYTMLNLTIKFSEKLCVNNILILRLLHNIPINANESHEAKTRRV